MAAKVAFVDPMLTLSLPKYITAYTGIDALVHSIEGYTATLSQPISDSLALSAIELIHDNIRKAYANGNNVTARYNMMLGSMLAGIAFGNSDVASVHCMGEAMGGSGRYTAWPINGGMLAVLYRIQYPTNPEKFAEIAQALGETTAGCQPWRPPKNALVR